MNQDQTYLARAKALIDTPEKWCQGADAYTATGKGVAPDDPAACRWCMSGAMSKAGARPGELDTGIRRFLDRAVGQSYVAWNDVLGRTHTEVMAAFDRAIELAGRESA